jgi:formylglycine-generating enzyme required for sulfatase activity
MRWFYFVILSACYPSFPEDKAAQFPENPWHDYDQDGYTEMSGDCDDEVPGIPAPVTYYLDADDDGFGDVTESHTSCINLMPEGYINNSTDCNDADPQVYPGASRDGPGLCVRDSDGDGYGDTTASAPYDRGSDCNDDDDTIYPGSSQEGGGLCVLDKDNDGFGDENAELPYDQGSDCNDEDSTTFPGSSREGGGLCVQDLDGDGYGDKNPPAGFDVGWDCNDSESSTFPGSSREGGNICVLDTDGDGYGDSSAEYPYDPGTDCNDNNDYIYLGSAFLEPWLCALDSDGDGYGDAVPGNQAEAGRDCNDADNSVYPGLNNEPGVLCILDADGDGYGDMNPALSQYDAGTDCDDTNPQTNPFSYEVCDEIDNDCDSEIDEPGSFGGLTWHVDSDGDGYGSMTAATLTSCEESPTGYSLIGLDCDDSNPASFPGNVETCDYADNDCNGLIDENVTELFYLDSDGDGYGDSTQLILECIAPTNYVSDNTDCDDSDGTINPGVVEGLADNIDQNCDGIERCYIDNDGDGYGSVNESDSTTSSCLISGFSDNNTDCNDANSIQYPGAPELCNGEDDDCNLSVDDNPVGQSTWFLDADGDGDGDSTDADGDGTPDNYLIACPVYDPLPSAPAGYAETSGDCNDSSTSISSLENELCSPNIDENCDGNMTLGAMDAELWYADSDGDNFGNEAYTIISCPNYDSNGQEIPPNGYVGLVIDQVTGLEVYDCDDNDGLLFPGNTELCNGKLDDCDAAEDSDGDGVVEYTARDEERDDDLDGYIECDYTANTWTNILTEPNGWGDCQDDDADVYPGAPELCTGEVEDCDSPDYGSIPDNEYDDDGDGYVECTGYISVGWEGQSSVSGGDDCDDSVTDLDQDGVFDGYYTYPGAAYNYPSSANPDPTFCASDADGDGNPDCVRWISNNTQPSPSGYSCDYGIFLTSDIGPDFNLILSGADPESRYILTNDFYMMTTEVTRGMFEAAMGYDPSIHSHTQYSDYSVENVTYYEAAEFANALSALAGLDLCYNELSDYEPASDYSGSDFYNCPGYRLPTEAEWEYATRSGMTGLKTSFWSPDYIWTPDGGGILVGSTCGSGAYIDDGVTLPSSSSFAWSCYNNFPSGSKEVALLDPNGNGLYDLHGNVSEIVQDFTNNYYVYNHVFPYGNLNNSPTFSNPVGSPTGIYKVLRGGSYHDSVFEIGVNSPNELSLTGYSSSSSSVGFRLVKTAL